MKQLKWMAMIAIFAFSMLASSNLSASSLTLTQENNIELAQDEQIKPRKKRKRRKRATKRRKHNKRKGCRANNF